MKVLPVGVFFGTNSCKFGYDYTYYDPFDKK
jgi:hypothetical protein